MCSDSAASLGKNPTFVGDGKSMAEVGIMALDTKGDLSEPLESIAKALDCESDLRRLEVRPDDAPPSWTPAYTLNVLADASIPFSTYAKILVDVATAAGQKGGQAFFKNAAQIAIQNAMATLAACKGRFKTETRGGPIV
jgi:hypothetical protein